VFLLKKKPLQWGFVFEVICSLAPKVQPDQHDDERHPRAAYQDVQVVDPTVHLSSQGLNGLVRFGTHCLDGSAYVTQAPIRLLVSPFEPAESLFGSHQLITSHEL
jgi:hypothetical protein